MKRILHSAVAFLASLAIGSQLIRSADIYTAHEWGTFTTISGSDGAALPWWTPTLEGPAVLPEFVQGVPSFRKTMAPSLMRMETPVIYFYPMAPMSVSVGVDYPNGRLTEAFPSVNLQLPGAAPSSGARLPQYAWTVDLLPPTSINAEAMPPVKGRGAHYQHAREVPEAWIVRGQASLNNTPKSPKQTEKFIFYRGTGGGTLPLTVMLTKDRSALVTSWTQMTTDAYLIQIKDGAIRWRKANVGFNQTQIQKQTPIKIEAPDQSQDAEQLAAALRQTLIDARLTEKEAAAMVATWTDAWLHEEGNRLLYLLPRSWIDSTLPLTLKPKPSKLERVFVARAELFSPEQEKRLADVFRNSPSDDVLAKNLADLHVGRFAPAALERVVRLNEKDLRDAFARVSAIAQNQKQPN